MKPLQWLEEGARSAIAALGWKLASRTGPRFQTIIPKKVVPLS